MKKDIKKVMIFALPILAIIALLLSISLIDRENDEEMWEMIRVLRSVNFNIEEQTIMDDANALVRIFRRGRDGPEPGVWIYFLMTSDRRREVLGIGFYQHGMRYVDSDGIIVTARPVYLSSRHPNAAYLEVCLDAKARYEAFMNDFELNEAELIALARWYHRTDPFYRRSTPS